LETGIISPVELRRKGIGAISAIAKELGIELGTLREQAQQQVCEVRASSNLPPVNSP
jgi:hypothetical protein